ncbi:MAG: dephospho-CoA kinase [Rhodospirillales bacterium]|nr:dephospho-CoA kinase [Rhodospirillales bacterium]
MIILGLTGSIGMGKSTAAGDFRRMGVAVHDADAEVHQLMAPAGAAFAPLCQAFPDMVTAGTIDRRRLGDRVFADPAALRQLEAILHPLVRQQKLWFLKKAAARGRRLVVLDIPLLFETGGEADCDGVCVVTAPKFVQRGRVLRRPGMSLGKFHRILASQVPDALKCEKADFVIDTSRGRLVSRRMIRHIVDEVRLWHPCKWPSKRAL